MKKQLDYNKLIRIASTKPNGSEEQLMYFSKQKIIDFMKGFRVTEAEVGLMGDWDWNSASIKLTKSGEIKIHNDDCEPHPCSFWAIPTLMIDGQSYDVSTFKEGDALWTK